MTVVKYGRVCILHMPIAFTGLASKATTVIATLPDEFKPLIKCQEFYPIATAGSLPLSVTIRESGDIEVYNYTDNTGTLNVRMAMTYMSAT